VLDREVRAPRQYPNSPVVGVGAVIVQDGVVLLVRRRYEPLAGQWSLPGGRLELGETLEAGLAREMLEETGLEVEVGPVIDVFDRILLDPERRVRTELSTDRLAGAMNKLRTWAGRQKDPFLQFAADPQFQESFDHDSGKLVLASHEESYRIETEPAEQPGALAEYREFLDWYARLNTLLQAGPPPEPRLQVNAALARYQVVPMRVELTRAGDKEPLRAEHDFTWRLSQDDRARIDDACASLAAYRPVDNAEFLRGAASHVSDH